MNRGTGYPGLNDRMVVIFGFGAGSPDDQGEVAPCVCPNCHNQVFLHHVQSKKSVRLYFVPVVPYGTNDYLVIYGTARITEGGAAELLQKLAHTYLGPGVRFPAMDNPPPGFITRIRVDRVSGVGPWTARR